MYAVIVLALLPIAFAIDSNEFPGPCPTFAPMSNFQIADLTSGKWFEIAEADSEEDRCIVVEYTTTPQQRRKTGINDDGLPYDKIRPFTSEGALIKLQSGLKVRNYTVVDMVKDSYLILVKCEDEENNTREEDVYIYVREPKLSDAANILTKAKATLAAKGVKVTRYTTIDQTNCKRP